ncbi:MAG: energy transducer TonB [Geobacteraceae bacterium]|nr:energy transducer TonB [Geobacteraceae bacterium]
MCIIISIAVHLYVLSFLIATPLVVQERPLTVVFVDLSQAKERKVASGPQAEVKAVRPKQGISRDEKASPESVVPARSDKKDLEPARLMERMESPSEPSVVAVPEPWLEAVGRPAAISVSSLQAGDYSAGTPDGGHGVVRDVGYPASAGSLLNPGGSAGSLRGGAQGEESWMEGGKNYNYIRDEILKRIRYPDKARRLGLEGRVLLSFTVLENGTVSEIQVLKSSDYRLLDEAAKEAVAGTRIRKPLPYRVIVHLPIAYRLQGTREGRL